MHNQSNTYITQAYSYNIYIHTFDVHNEDPESNHDSSLYDRNSFLSRFSQDGHYLNHICYKCRWCPISA